MRLLGDGVSDEFVRRVFVLNLYPVSAQNLRYLTCDDTVGGGGLGSGLGSRLGSGLGSGFLGDGDESKGGCVFDGDVDGLVELHIVGILGSGHDDRFLVRFRVLDLYLVGIDDLGHSSGDDAIGSRGGLGSGCRCGLLGDGDEFERCYLLNSDIDGLVELHVVRLLGDGVSDEFVSRVFVLNLHPVSGKYLRYFTCDDAVGGRNGGGCGFLGN